MVDPEIVHVQNLQRIDFFFNSTRGDWNTTHHFITSFSYVGTCGGTRVNVKNQTLGMFVLFFVVWRYKKSFKDAIVFKIR